jgi:hypothetical protein
MGARYQNFGLRGDTHTTAWVSFHENRTTLSADHLGSTGISDGKRTWRNRPKTRVLPVLCYCPNAASLS